MLDLVLAMRTADAATLHVGGVTPDHDTIAAAVAAASAGDTIEVAAGNYTERAIDVDVDLVFVGVGGSGAVSWTSNLNVNPLRIADGATVSVTGFSIVGRSAVAVRVEGATATFTDLRIHGNTMDEGNDGSAFVAIDASVDLVDADFDDNSAVGGRGAHLYAVRSTVGVDGGTFRRGVAGRGAGFFLDNSTVTVTGGSFSENVASEAGGAIAAVNGTLVVDGATFTANEAVGEAGFPFPQAGGDGGAFVFSESASVDLLNCLVEDSVAEVTGGAAVLEGRASLTTDTTRFVGNTADYGGAIYVGGEATLEALGTYFAQNEAGAGNGGAIRARTTGGAGGLVVNGSLFVENRASQTGGAIATTSESGDSIPVEVTLSEFTDNASTTQGGAVSFDDPTSLAVDNTLFCHNRSAGDGGGAWVAGAGADHRWTNVIFAENRADASGGGLYVEPGADDTEVFDAGFFGNSSPAGGGIFLADAPAVVSNTIIAWTQEGDGIAGSAPSLAVDYGDFFQNAAQDLPNGVSGTGNLFVDPLLSAYSRDGDCDNDEFWIVAGSPLVDVGNPAVDDIDGSRSDIGPYGGPDAAWPELADTDGDGSLATVDCDDGDATVFPGNPERCNGSDDDCDGVADEEPTDAGTWWTDADGDGYGVDGTEVVACDAPAGTADAGGDCDDAVADTHPGAPELCDDADNNCDGTGDQGAEADYWPDADGDGFGDRDAAPTSSCGPIPGSVDNGDDCDDAAAGVFPGAEDPAGDGVDADCDGADGGGPTDPGPDTTDDTRDSRIKVGSGCAGCDAGGGGVSLLGLAGALLAVSARRRR